MPPAARVCASTLVALAFLAVVAPLALFLPLLETEGMLTMAAAEAALQDPVPVLLSQKFRPVGTLLNLPAASLGWTPFLLWHVLLAATAIGLLGRTAARLGGSGLLAALVVATSPSFILASLTGQSNTDATLAVALGLYLWVVRDARLAAGLVLGAAPWVRYELLPFAIALAVYAALRKADRRVFGGMCVFPSGFLVAGAVYHGDLLWWLHYAPTLLDEAPGLHFLEGIRPEPPYLAGLPARLLQVTPLWILPLAVSWRGRPPLVRMLDGTLALSFVLMVGIPFFAVLNFEHSPRYLMVMLPFAALAVARVPETEVGPWRALALAALALGAGLVALFGPARAPLAAWATVAVPGVVVFVERARGLRAATPVIVALALAGVATLGLTSTDFSRLPYASPAPDLTRAVEWLSRSEAAARAPALHTNEMRLSKLLGEAAPGLAPRVRLWLQHDALYEVYALHDRSNGQAERVASALRHTVYGSMLFPCEVENIASFEGELLVFASGSRLEYLYPPEFQAALGVEVARFGKTSVLEGRAPPPGGYPGMRPLDAPWLRLGCPAARALASELRAPVVPAI